MNGFEGSQTNNYSYDEMACVGFRIFDGLGQIDDNDIANVAKLVQEEHQDLERHATFFRDPEEPRRVFGFFFSADEDHRDAVTKHASTLAYASQAAGWEAQPLIEAKTMTVSAQDSRRYGAAALSAAWIGMTDHTPLLERLENERNEFIARLDELLDF
jgi:hypothetical protein